jgi:ankyrin repeat protein
MKPKSLLIIIAAFFSATYSTLGAESSDELLQKGLLEEEANHNLAAAVQAYQSVIDRFNAQRKDAATALFRLAECHRKLGKTNDAIAGYQRVIREFPDVQSLVDPSGKALTALGAGVDRSTSSSISARAPTITNPEQLKLLQQEIQLAERETAVAEAKVRNGQGEAAGIARAKNELLSLQRQLPENATVANQQKLIGEQIKLQEQLLTEMRKRIQVGAAAPLDEAPLERALLRLKRELIAVETPASPAGGNAAGLVSVNVPGEDTTSAVRDDEAKEIQRLKNMIKNSPDLINGRGPTGETLLAEAAAGGRLEVVHFLLDQKADVGTALHLAALNGHKAMVDLLLANGADVNARDRSGKTPIHHASSRGFVKVAETLIAHSADVNAGRGRMQTPLAAAAAGGHSQVIELLLANKANPNVGDSKGATPLILAVLGNQPACARILLEHGADPNAAASEGSPLGVAARQGSQEIATLLLQHGAKANVKISSEVHPLLSAVKDGNLVLTKALLAAGADPNVVSENVTALFSAVGIGKNEFVELLLEKGADPNATTHDTGFTALHQATRKGNVEAAKLLVAKGADVNINDFLGYTPLWYAFDRTPRGPGVLPRQTPEQAVIADLLIQHGAKVPGPRPVAAPPKTNP